MRVMGAVATVKGIPGIAVWTTGTESSLDFVHWHWHWYTGIIDTKEAKTQEFGFVFD